MVSMQSLENLYDRAAGILAHFDGLASVLLRLILAPVLIMAGWEKLTGENWFGFQQESFPFPSNVLPADVLWFLASWTEFLGEPGLLSGAAAAKAWRLITHPL